MLEACRHLAFVEGFSPGRARDPLGRVLENKLISEDSSVGFRSNDSCNGFGEKRMFPDIGDQQQTQKRPQKRIPLNSLGDGHKAPVGVRGTPWPTRSLLAPQSPVSASSAECSSPQHPPAPPHNSPPGDLAQGGVCFPATQGTPSPNPSALKQCPQRDVGTQSSTSHECKVCGETFSAAHLLTRHIREHHEETRYVCELFGKGFRLPSCLPAHAETHADLGKPFQCSECPKRFSHPRKLRAHAQLHRAARPFACEWCGKSFRTRSQLCQHIWTHTGERPFDCPECGKAFRSRNVRAKHLRIHTGERPYTCPQCGKGFRCQDDLQGHLVTHTDQKPFQCPECGKAYRWRSSLNGHLKMHQLAQPFTCGECGRVYSDSSHFRRHVRGHYEERPFMCHCGQGFDRAAALHTHVRQTHAGEKR
ncbi:oocyte zinc finger protein XlCOF6.1-like [Sorex araneus]|uniref:oocyte zinc finger protein XlCOF6.1-like n=1 Tax=Sorex araneus TaxID=42254 RepID=UPI002433FD99|nr:oocyte zinc finger protein XlCOF6.1-like [Sorex araneus]